MRMFTAPMALELSDDLCLTQEPPDEERSGTRVSDCSYIARAL